MSYMKFDVLQESIKAKENCLPLDLSYIPKGYRLACMNTHVYNVMMTTVGSLVASAVVQYAIHQSLKGFLPLALLMTGLSVLPLVEQYDARDFCLIKASDTKYFDVSNALMNCPVLATNDGKVISVVNNTRNDAAPGNISLQAAGNHVVISHNNGEWYSLYAHLYYGSIKVKEGQLVKKGQKIAELGNTGNSTAPHLHFEFTRTNPMRIGIGKGLDNFEPYKYTSMPWKGFLSVGLDIFNEYYSKPLVWNKFGDLDALCYLT